MDDLKVIKMELLQHLECMQSRIHTMVSFLEELHTENIYDDEEDENESKIDLSLEESHKIGYNFSEIKELLYEYRELNHKSNVKYK